MTSGGSRSLDGRTVGVVGGGPAGLMAAEVLAQRGAQVTVYDHMPSVGRKLLLAGRGGLNLTHSEALDQLLDRYGPDRPAVEPAIRAFTPRDLRNWCAGLGEPTVVGTGGRVFPTSLRATPLLRAWLRRLDGLGVTIALRHRWIGWGCPEDAPDPRLLRFSLPSHDHPVERRCDAAVFALGGASWPRVGSDGRWTDAFASAGVVVRQLEPSNAGVRVAWTSTFADRFEGVPLKNVAVRVAGASPDRGELVVRGDAMVTRTGLEGSPVYPHARAIRDRLQRDGRCTLLVDLQPDVAADRLAERWSRRRSSDSTATALRRTMRLEPVAIGLLREATGNHLPTEATELAALITRVPVTVAAMMPIARAISSAGGIHVDEIDESFMVRRLPGTFVAGEMLDWEAPTGGYLLQATFSTARAAALGAASWLAGRS